MHPGMLFVLVLAIATACVGKYESDFSLVVANGTPNVLRVVVNGGEVGDVGAGLTVSFTLHLAESNANVFTNGVAPTPQALATLSAIDRTTGATSAPKTVTLTRGSATAVTFAAADFPSASPVAAFFTFAPVAPAVNQNVLFNAAG